ncbi:MAG: hypothetical protein IKY47_05810 [Bacteroidaceae bacterium]|nr:hypothetical protein [Bacteroidaceae bacterium]
MKRIFILLAVLFCMGGLQAQDYLQIVTFESESGVNGVFTTAGAADDKKGVESDAIKSLFYTLMFSGVDGVNNDKPLVYNSNPSYTNSYFNSAARYVGYVVEAKEVDKPKKVGNRYQGTYRVTIRLKQLVNDVKKNTGGKEAEQKADKEAKRLVPKPKIMVVPFRKDGEDYKAILENDRDLRAAVSEVQKGFEALDIETESILSSHNSNNRRAQYEESVDAASSNLKQLLLSADADVYVVVDLEKNISASGSSVSVILTAYETATDNIWATENSWTNRFNTTNITALCSYAVRDYLPSFLEQIVKNYNEPSSIVIQFSVKNGSMVSMRDRCSNGRRLSDVIQEWLDDNAHDGEYHVQGIVDESAVFDDVLIPKADEKGKKMNAEKFGSRLCDALYAVGVDTEYNTEGNNVLITVLSIE